MVPLCFCAWVAFFFYFILFELSLLELSVASVLPLLRFPFTLVSHSPSDAFHVFAFVPLVVLSITWHAPLFFSCPTP